jgi:hypothetical protein
MLTIEKAWPYFHRANVMGMGLNNANTPENSDFGRNTVKVESSYRKYIQILFFNRFNQLVQSISASKILANNSD